jgi:RNA polymerase sigma factor (sigma-70 family)
MSDTVAEKDPSTDLVWSALWKTAYQRYFRLWMNLARSAEISDDDAKDVVQNVVAGIIAEPSRHFESLEHARNYVAKSVLNRVKAHKARGSRRCAWEDDVERRFAVNQADYEGDDRVRRDALRRAIRRLPRRDFNILKMRFYSGFTLAQTGQLLSMPISTVASREAVILRKIRMKLRKNGF